MLPYFDGRIFCINTSVTYVTCNGSGHAQLEPFFQMSMLSGPSSRLCSAIPSLARSVFNRAATRPVPPPQGIHLPPPASPNALTLQHGTDTIATPGDFLKAIGRSSETKVTVEKWEDFWKTSGHDLKKSGLGVRDRRYILWCMEKFRSGTPIKEFAHEARPKKTVRGWGPSVQNGKRLRSRRLKNKK